MNLRDHRARPWRAPDDPDHVECLRCGDPIRPAGTSWRHLDEDEAPNRPLPSDTPTFDAAVELAVNAMGNLPSDADDAAKAFAVVDVLYWRGGLSTKPWRRPDRRTARRRKRVA